jgi:hypothetical protein
LPMLPCPCRPTSSFTSPTKDQVLTEPCKPKQQQNLSSHRPKSSTHHDRVEGSVSAPSARRPPRQRRYAHAASLHKAPFTVRMRSFLLAEKSSWCPSLEGVAPLVTRCAKHLRIGVEEVRPKHGPMKFSHAKVHVQNEKRNLY